MQGREEKRQRKGRNYYKKIKRIAQTAKTVWKMRNLVKIVTTKKNICNLKEMKCSISCLSFTSSRSMNIHLTCFSAMIRENINKLDNEFKLMKWDNATVSCSLTASTDKIRAYERGRKGQKSITVILSRFIYFF